jgi:hypothetical protein
MHGWYLLAFSFIFFFTISFTGWFDKWKNRHDISFRQICGESAAVDQSVIQYWQNSVLPQLIKDYKAADIYNADEIALFWRMLPDKTLHFKGEVCAGGKSSKERVSVLLCTNLDGSHRMKPIVIGKQNLQGALEALNTFLSITKATQRLGCPVRFLKNGFVLLIVKWLQQIAKSYLFLDNCPAHPPSIQGSCNIRVAFLPPNTTSKLQPCDQGIILAFKRQYRHLLLPRYLAAIESNRFYSIQLSDAIHLINSSWMAVKSPISQAAWRRSGISVDQNIIEAIPDDENLELVNIFQSIGRCMKIPPGVQPQTYIDADEDVETSGIMTNRDIALAVTSSKSQQHGEDDNDDNIPEIPMPNTKDALDSIRK